MTIRPNFIERFADFVDSALRDHVEFYDVIKKKKIRYVKVVVFLLVITSLFLFFLSIKDTNEY